MQTAFWIAGVYLAICVAGYFASRHLMFFPNPHRTTPAQADAAGIDELEIAASDGTKLVVWYAEAKQGRPTVLYFHGNAGNAAGRAPKIERMRANGYGVFYLNNRGYGGSQGSPSELANVSDALSAYDYLTGLGIRPDQIVLYGESLGSGQAIRAGTSREVKAVVLEAPLTSTIDVGRRSYWFLPLKLLLRDYFHNEENIKQLKKPLLVLHGSQDAVIPVAQGRRVFEAGNKPKRLEIFDDAGHSDLFGHGAWEKVEDFVDGF